MPDSLISSPFLYNVSLTLIHFIWQGFFVAFALKLALSLTSYKKPQLRYAFSSLAMVANLLLPLLTFFIIYQPEFQQYSSFSHSSIFLNDAINSEAQNTATWYTNVVEFLPYLSLSWVAVSFGLAIKLFIELYNVNQLPKIGTISATTSLEARFHQLVQQVNLKHTPRILISLKSNVPMAIGWLKPIVLIPVSMLSGLTPAQLDMLILHELAHIRRHDYLVNFLQTLVEIFLFFHPGVRWVSKQMRNEREYCSDDIAVQHCGNPIAYAHTLADTASLCVKHRHHSIPAMAMAASGGDLKQRVIRLIDQNHHCSTDNNSGKLLASVAIIFSIVAVLSKNYIQFPTLDLSSGTLSLYRGASDNFTRVNANSNETILPSLAQQLLHQKDKIPFSKTVSSQEMLSPTQQVASTFSPKIMPPTAKLNIEAVIDHKIIPEKNNTNKRIVAMAAVNNEEVFVPLEEVTTQVSTVLNGTLAIEQEKSSLSDTQKMIDKSLAQLALNDSTFKEKSISDLAFERTDSTNSGSVLNNPYAQQVATLSNTPLSVTPSFSLAVNTDFGSEEQVFSARNNTKNNFKAIRSSAQLLSSSAPKYPSNAKRRGIEADIQVTFTIDKKGYIRDIQYDGKGKTSYFRYTIRTALEQWRFAPASYNDQPVESTMSKIFSFSLAK